MNDINKTHKALFHRIPQKMHPTQRLADEIVYLEDAKSAAFDLGQGETVNILGEHLLLVRRQYKLEMIKPA